MTRNEMHDAWRFTVLRGTLMHMADIGPEWGMLANLLRQARAELGPNVTREQFARDRGGSARIMADLERGARSNYDAQTLINAEVWYGLQPGQITEYLDACRELHADFDKAGRDLVDRIDEIAARRRTREVPHPGASVSPGRDDADGVLLDLPDEALQGLGEIEREEVIAAARLAALKKAREIRAGGQVGLFTVD